ncbi:hypothetical protein GUJ93_ZPchr0012g19548 [Zizania palustris]|uniref:Uncharacterized protein n=1 Tax=Zizania palustris TaxID=103762 RepID=A0A8J5WNI6_ZIZPA|nr:hypothetical protein GUJ93_ZPchr0012g19548 [Zizania palustris]
MLAEAATARGRRSKQGLSIFSQAVPHRLEFIKDHILKLEPTSTQKKKSKKTGSQPIQVREETRKGPWTEQEDLQLLCTVRLFGERRWDFIAKVSGLNRTGKSCRLRWVNYLHPGLKRGRMSPHEERLILELHARWGNRWSRIARRLPGRTDNEIKNYWRTHMRKKAQESKRNMSPSSSSSSLTYQACHPETPSMIIGVEEQEIHGGSGCITSILKGTPADMDGYPMDQIWMEIEAPDVLSGPSFDEGKDNAYNSLSAPLLPSPVWDCYCAETCLRMDEDIKVAPQFGYGKGAGPCY